MGQGYNTAESAFDAVRWTAAGGTVDLGDLPGGSFNSGARAVSADGSLIVGSAISAASDPNFEAFRWTQAGGMVALGTLAGGTHTSYTAGVSADGSVVAGGADSATGFQSYRWTQAGGMIGIGNSFRRVCHLSRWVGHCGQQRYPRRNGGVPLDAGWRTGWPGISLAAR